MAEELGERTEAPTARRLSEARNDGQIAKSPELGATIDLIGGLLALVFLGSWLVRGSAELLRHLLDARSSGSFTRWEDVEPVLWWSAKQGAMVVVPFLGVAFAASYLAQFVQVGWLLTLNPLRPKLSRLNPAAGVKRIVGRRNVIKTALNLVKLAIMLSVAYAIVLRNASAIATIPLLDVLPAMALMGKVVMDLCVWLLAVMLVIALADYAFQRWQHTQELKMTKQQIKDELRSMEGDMETKGRRLRLARQMALQRLQMTVPKADVVITNPTHFSVALEYDAAKMAAPRVVAKGADFMAFRIREIATANRIPIVEKPPLARALYADVPVGRQVSPEFYEAVAEVLAYVYRLENKRAG
jgi:flagellar biosynthetic protein FlhB